MQDALQRHAVCHCSALVHNAGPQLSILPPVLWASLLDDADHAGAAPHTAAAWVQAWLQEVAWTEAELPKQLAQRNSRATSPREAAQLQREPMFCYETALKLLKWSSLTYTDFGQAPPEPGGQLNCSTGDRLGGRTSGLRLHAPCRWRPPSSGSGGTRISNAQGDK